MTDRDDYNRDRMRQDEDTYFAVTERPPQALGAVAAAVMAQAEARARAKPRRPRKIKEQAR